MMPAPELIASAFVLGFAGSVHCLAMCGGIAGALAQSADGGARGRARASGLHAVGRITTYALAGALAGQAGSVAVGAPSSARVWIRFALGAALVLIGWQVAARGRVLAPLERAGYAFWRRLTPLMVRLGRPRRPVQRIALGLLWGALPCGLVYAALIVASATGSALGGAGAMVAFGLGTLPAVLAASSVGSLVERFGGNASLRRTSGGLLVAFGLWSLVGTWALTDGHDAAFGPAPHADCHAHAYAPPDPAAPPVAPASEGAHALRPGGPPHALH